MAESPQEPAPRARSARTTANCPICGQIFPVSDIQQHADECASKRFGGDEGVKSAKPIATHPKPHHKGKHYKPMAKKRPVDEAFDPPLSRPDESGPSRLTTSHGWRHPDRRFGPRTHGRGVGRGGQKAATIDSDADYVVIEDITIKCMHLEPSMPLWSVLRTAAPPRMLAPLSPPPPAAASLPARQLATSAWPAAPLARAHALLPQADLVQPYSSQQQQQQQQQRPQRPPQPPNPQPLFASQTQRPPPAAHTHAPPAAGASDRAFTVAAERHAPARPGGEAADAALSPSSSRRPMAPAPAPGARQLASGPFMWPEQGVQLADELQTEAQLGAAEDYLCAVRRALAAQPERLRDFLAILSAFVTGEVDTLAVMERVAVALQGEEALLLGFNQFLPKAYRLQPVRAALGGSAPSADAPRLARHRATVTLDQLCARLAHHPEVLEPVLAALDCLPADADLPALGSIEAMVQVGARGEIRGMSHELVERVRAASAQIDALTLTLPRDARKLLRDFMGFLPAGMQHATVDATLGHALYVVESLC